MKYKQKQLLLDLRSQLVGAMHVQPFTIYTDDTIEALVEAQPRTIPELEAVKGFPKGGKRVIGFGEAVVAVFNNCNGIDTIGVTVDENTNSASVCIKLKELHAF